MTTTAATQQEALELKAQLIGVCERAADGFYTSECLGEEVGTRLYHWRLVRAGQVRASGTARSQAVLDIIRQTFTAS